MYDDIPKFLRKYFEVLLREHGVESVEYEIFIDRANFLSIDLYAKDPVHRMSMVNHLTDVSSTYWGQWVKRYQKNYTHRRFNL